MKKQQYSYQLQVPIRWVSAHALALPLLVMVLTLSACGDGATKSSAAVLPGAGGTQGSTLSSLPLAAATGGVLQVLDDDDFNALSVLQRYQVANKLMATLYKGVSVNEFLDLDQGLNNPTPAIAETWLSDVYRTIQTPLTAAVKLQLDLEILGSDELDVVTDFPIEARYSFTRQRAREIPLARIYHYPLSLDSFSQWVAWNLANSILFSPAEELDSVEMTDVQNIFRRLEKSVATSADIESVVFEHMRSLENWRRFRSPEDNTREMMEIFLGFENLDDQVPAASAACQDLFLTSENEGYLLAYSDFPNTEPQEVLGSQVISCDDFYRVVASHENLIPTIATVVVRYFFAEQPLSFQLEVVEDIVQRNPRSFFEIFAPILFSEAYLLDAERPKSFEEAYLGTASRLEWQANADMFRAMASGSGSGGRLYMSEMGWAAMSNKLGRSAGVATDSLSFANFHKALREELLIKDYRWRESLGISEPEPLDLMPLPQPPPGASQQAIDDYNLVNAQYEESVSSLSAADQYVHSQKLADYFSHEKLYLQLKKYDIPEFIDYLFISVVARKAHDEEKRELIALFDKEGWLRVEDERAYINNWHRNNVAQMVFDYLSRLPETYYLTTVGEQG